MDMGQNGAWDHKELGQIREQSKVRKDRETNRAKMEQNVQQRQKGAWDERRAETEQRVPQRQKEVRDKQKTRIEWRTKQVTKITKLRRWYSKARKERDTR